MSSEKPEHRSRVMRAVKSTDTEPERKIRRLLTASGYRYRLHYKDLPGKPDIVFVGRKKCIFVHGCFWHQHQCPRGNRQPKANSQYWFTKLQGNKERDRQHIRGLAKSGWDSMVVWECELRNPDSVLKKLAAFLR